MGTPRCIDLGVLGDFREAERVRAILGEDTPWTCLCNLAALPTYRLLTVEFLCTFRYRAHQAAVRVEEDAELPPDIEFYLGGQHFEMSIKRFAVQLGIYYEPETVSDDFAHGLTQGRRGNEGLVGPDIRYAVHRRQGVSDDDQGSSDQIVHQCIVTTISGRGQSQEWVTTTDLFYLHSLIAGRPCNPARCFALYYASFYHRQERGTLWGGAFITHIARTRGMVDMLDDLPAIEPRKLDRRTIINMKLAADIPGLGLRFIGQDGRPFQPAQEQPVQSPPHREEEPPQHPPHVYRAVRLTDPLEALLHHIAARCDETARQMARLERRLDRYEDLVQWTVPSEHARRDGSQLPPFPEPRVYADDGSSAGPSGS
ncbi:hypothetical protein R6Q57_018286 [Mikania cordata]